LPGVARERETALRSRAAFSLDDRNVPPTHTKLPHCILFSNENLFREVVEQSDVIFEKDPSDIHNGILEQNLSKSECDQSPVGLFYLLIIHDTVKPGYCAFCGTFLWNY
jgi:hypothetical protein